MLSLLLVYREPVDSCHLSVMNHGLIPFSSLKNRWSTEVHKVLSNRAGVGTPPTWFSTSLITPSLQNSGGIRKYL